MGKRVCIFKGLTMSKHLVKFIMGWANRGTGTCAKTLLGLHTLSPPWHGLVLFRETNPLDLLSLMGACHLVLGFIWSEMTKQPESILTGNILFLSGRLTAVSFTWSLLFSRHLENFLWPPDAKSWLTGKDPDAGKDWRQEKGMTEDEMVGWHHQLNGHEFG